MVDEEELDWIKKDDARVCNFVYQHIKNAGLHFIKKSNKNLGLTPLRHVTGIGIKNTRRGMIYIESIPKYIRPLLSEPVSTKGKYFYIVNTIDSLAVDKNIKRNFLVIIRKMYFQSLNI